MSFRRKIARGSPRGQGLAEFALVLPVLALVLLSILQIAVLLGTQIGLTNATREAARIASITATRGDLAAQTNGDAVLSRLRTVLLPTNVMTYSSGQVVTGVCPAVGTPGAGTRITYTAANDVSGTPAVFVRVDVVYRHPLFIPLVGGILDGIDGVVGDGLSVGASEEFRVDNLRFDTTPPGFPVCRT